MKNIKKYIKKKVSNSKKQQKKTEKFRTMCESYKALCAVQFRRNQMSVFKYPLNLSQQ